MNRLSTPSIGILQNIERQSGHTTLALIKLLAVSLLPISVMRLIMQELRAGEDKLEFTDEQIKVAIPDLMAFLLRGIGQQATITSDVIKSLKQPDWRDMFMTYVGIMGRPISEFKSITLEEYALVVEGFCMLHQIDIQSVAIPATSQDLAEMLERFPDEKIEHNSSS